MDCIIFDSDGTLVDSEHLCNGALAEALRHEGVVENVASLVTRYRGGRLATILADLQGIHGVRFGEALEPRYRALVAEWLEARLRPISGVAEALERIQTPKCVASGGPMAKIRQALRVCGLAHHFGDRVFSSYEVESWKPDPGLFVFAARAMNVPPSRCAVVEDTHIGVEAALAAGMKPFFYDPEGDRSARLDPRVTAFQDMANLPTLLTG